MDQKNARLISIIKDAKNQYSEDNLVLAIPRFLSKKFTAFCSMREDILLIKEYIKKLHIENDNIINSALTYSTISLYGKCFTDASNTKSPKLEPNELFEPDSQFMHTHKYIMNLRHNFIAHRGDTESEVCAAYMLVPKEEGQTQVRYAQTKQMKLDPIKLKEIDELADYLIEKLMIKIQKSGQKTHDAFFDNFDAKQMTFMLLNNVKND